MKKYGLIIPPRTDFKTSSVINMQDSKIEEPKWTIAVNLIGFVALLGTTISRSQCATPNSDQYTSRIKIC